MSNSVKELVNAFNLNNYFSGKINTSFVVKDKKIIGLFTHDTDVTKYLQRIREEIVKRHYGTEVAGEFYNLSYFPFFLGRSYNKRHVNKGLTVVEFADSTNDKVIHNLKIHFAKEVERAVKLKVISYLQEEIGITEEEAYKWIKEAVRLGAMDRSSPYLYCIAFSDEYFKREGYEDSLETLELLKELYIEEFNSRLREYGLRSSDFYEFKGDILYIKNINDRTVRSVTEYVKGRVALDFRTPGTVESKVENCKDVLSDLIFKSTGKLVYGYDYDVFVDKKKIERGNKYALIPLVEVYDKNYGGGRLDPLNKEDAKEFNKKFGEVLRDISGKTEDGYGQIANSKGPVYAFSNKRIAQLLPIIMQSPIAYNKEFWRFEFAVNLEKFRNRQRSFSPNPGSDGEDSPSSSLSGIDSPMRFPNRSPSLSEVNGSVRNEPGYRGSVASKGSEFSKRSSGYYSGSTSSVADTEPSAGPSTRPSDENWFFRDSSRASSVSSSSTSDSISSNASVDTIVAGKGGLPHLKAQLTGPAGFPAARRTKAMKGVPTAVDSSKCSVHGLGAVTGTATFVPVSVSYVKPVGFEYLRHDESTIKEFLANGKREWGDKEKCRRSTKQATKERVY